jgi:hypothetical protein
MTKQFKRIDGLGLDSESAVAPLKGRRRHRGGGNAALIERMRESSRRDTDSAAGTSADVSETAASLNVFEQNLGLGDSGTGGELAVTEAPSSVEVGETQEEVLEDVEAVTTEASLGGSGVGYAEESEGECEDPEASTAQDAESSESLGAIPISPNIDALHSAAQVGDLFQFEQLSQAVLAERSAAISNVSTTRIEDMMGTEEMAIHGYAGFLEWLVKEASTDMFDGEKEAEFGQLMIRIIDAHLKLIRNALDVFPDSTASGFAELDAAWKEDTALLARATANVGGPYDEKGENVRSKELSSEYIIQTLNAMSLEDAITWVEELMSDIDDNQSQSEDLKLTYATATQACKEVLMLKLSQAKTTDNPEVVQAQGLRIAKLFRNDTGKMDSDLIDSEFSAAVLKDIVNWPELAMAYVERNVDGGSVFQEQLEREKPNVLAGIRDKFAGEEMHPTLASVLQQLEKKPSDLEEIAAQVGMIKVLNAFSKGAAMPDPISLLDSIILYMTPHIGKMIQTFESQLAEKDFDLTQIQSLTGINFTDQQAEAFEMIKDIEGVGAFDMSDANWQRTQAGLVLVGVIGAGVLTGVGLAAMGVGVVGSAIGGGVAGTAVSAMANPRGFDSAGEAATQYGPELALNMATAGAARYAQAGRIIAQLKALGKLKTGQAQQILEIATKGGDEWGRLLASLDEAALGIRMTGAVAEGGADLAIGSLLDATYQRVSLGGSFTEHFIDSVEMNLVFMGVGMSADLSSGAKGLLRGLFRDKTTLSVQLEGSYGNARAAQTQLQSIFSSDPQMAAMLPRALEDPRAMMSQLSTSNMTQADISAAQTALTQLAKAQDEFKTNLSKITDLIDQVDSMTPRKDLEVFSIIEKTPEGLVIATNSQGLPHLYASEAELKLYKEKLSPERLSQTNTSGGSDSAKVANLHADAAKVMPMFTDLVHTVGSQSGAVDSIVAPIKNLDNAVSKVTSNDGFPPEYVTDLARGTETYDRADGIYGATIVYARIDEMQGGIEALIRDPRVERISISDYMDSDDFPMVLVNIQIQGGHVAELQFNTAINRQAVSEGVLMPDDILPPDAFDFTPAEQQLVEELKKKDPNRRILKPEIQLPEYAEPINLHKLYEIIRAMSRDKSEIELGLMQKLDDMTTKVVAYNKAQYEAQYGEAPTSQLNL